MALVYTPTDPSIGKACPDFTLPGVDGKIYSRQDFLKGSPLLIMFICNHCPYVKAIEDRLIVLGQDLKKMGVHCLGICSNDPIDYPEDSFVKLKERWYEKKYSFPYLHDLDQSIAKNFGAVCTPDFFLYDADFRLAYRGRLDDSWKDSSLVRRRELFQACEALKFNKPWPFDSTPSMGCSIKWTK